MRTGVEQHTITPVPPLQHAICVDNGAESYDAASAVDPPEEGAVPQLTEGADSATPTPPAALKTKKQPRKPQQPRSGDGGIKKGRPIGSLATRRSISWGAVLKNIDEVTRSVTGGTSDMMGVFKAAEQDTNGAIASEIIAVRDAVLKVLNAEGSEARRLTNQPDYRFCAKVIKRRVDTLRGGK